MRGMTQVERASREKIIELLAKNGYVTYSKILSRFVLNLTADPDVIAYMIPGKGVIVLNQGLLMEQVSVCVRHEILHEMFQHMQRSIAKLGKAGSLKYHQLSNIAGDFDISNQGYTEADKQEMRNIRLNGAIIPCLVTEDEHPDWVNLTFEEMLEKLKEQHDKIEKMQPQGQSGQSGQEQGEGEGQGGGSGDGEGDEEGDNEGGGSSSNSDKSSGKKSKSKSGSDSGEGEEQEDKKGKDHDKNDSGKGDKDKVYWRDMKMDDEDGEGNRQPGEGDGESEGMSDIQRKEAEERAKEIAKETAENGGVDRSLEGVEGDVAELVDVFSSKETMSNIQGENRAAKINDNALRRERERQNKLASGNDNIAGIALRIKEFLAKEIGVNRVRQQTWGKPSRKGDNSPTQLARKGIRHRDDKNGKIPSVYFYIDQSGSWDDKDIEKGWTIVNQLLDYEKKGLLKVRLYYFANHVHDDPSLARSEGGTAASGEIVDHAREHKADNVIVMTDGDMDGQGTFDSTYKAPGAVWFIFRDRECVKIQQHLRGAKLTKVFRIK